MPVKRTLRIFARLALLPVLLAAPLAAQSGQPFAIHDGDRVVFYGDSITAQRLYTRFVEDLVLIRYPNLQAKFWNAGMGGDRVTGGGAGPVDLRLARDVYPLHPTVVTIMLGMNDGSYRGIDSDNTAAKYEAGYRSLVKNLQANCPGVRLFLIRPSPYDEIAHGPADGAARGYSAVIQHYGDIVAQIAKDTNSQLIDVNAPTTAELTKYTALDPALAKGLLPDRVHPSALASWAMAFAIVEAWHMQPIVMDVTLDAGTGASAAGGALTWTHKDNFVPIPINPTTANEKLLFQTTDLPQLESEKLRVTGLTQPSYTLTIDKTAVGAFTSQQLSAGIDLTHYLTPMVTQSLNAERTAQQRANIDSMRFDLLYQGTKVKTQMDGVNGLADWRDSLLPREASAFQGQPHTLTLQPTPP